VTLSDINRSLYADVFAKEDPLSHNKTYGVIQNPQVRRRKGKRPILPSAPPPKFQPVKEEKKPAAALKETTTNKPMPALKKESSLAKSQPQKKDDASSRESTPKPASLKRDASDIFKSFAKAKAKPKDTPLMDTDDGEEDEALFEAPKTSTKRSSDVKKERDDKAAKLRKMMDSDDEVEAATETEKPAEDSAADPGPETKPEDEDVAWSESDEEKATAKKTAEEPPKEESTGPKRKRGKRKVMKKRTMKDEDGYLVTKEEEAWESFSESDTEKVKPKAFAGFQKKAPPPKKAATTAAAPGRKSIASFFGKK
jgi:DNA polymerase delta subunit 3